MDKEQKSQESVAEPPQFQVVDKRKFLEIDKDNDDGAPAEEKTRYPSFVEELMTRTSEMEKKFEEKKKQIDEEIVRTKTRLENDFDRRLELEKQKILLPFLEVLDNLQRAIDAAIKAGSEGHLLEGVEMTADIFRAKLEEMGVEVIDALNQPFDPNSAQAVGRIRVPDPDQDGIVLEEYRTGYTINGQLLRPAQVRVGYHE
jgi:molecular chaperone GrpE